MAILSLFGLAAILYIAILFGKPCAIATEFIATDAQAHTIVGSALGGRLIGTSFNVTSLLSRDTPLESRDVFRIRVSGSKDSGVMEVVVTYDLGAWKVTAATFCSSSGNVVKIR